jgi:hypothetical protein
MGVMGEHHELMFYKKCPICGYCAIIWEELSLENTRLAKSYPTAQRQITAADYKKLYKR